MKSITPPNWPNQAAHYSPGVISGNLLYISGQLSADPLTKEVPATIAAETIAALTGMDNVLKAAGLTKNNVVSCRVYTTNVEYWDEINRVYAEYFGDHRPARAIVPVQPLHFGCNIEIEAIAELTP